MPLLFESTPLNPPPPSRSQPPVNNSPTCQKPTITTSGVIKQAQSSRPTGANFVCAHVSALRLFAANGTRRPHDVKAEWARSVGFVCFALFSVPFSHCLGIPYLAVRSLLFSMI